MITRPVSENWDHLQRWEQVNDNNEDIDMAELDNLDDENSNGGDPAEDELSDALENENDMAEPSNQTQGRCKLSQEIITRIINECIAHYTEEWEPNKGLLKEEKVVYDTVKMWADAEAKSRRQQLIAHHTAEVEHYTDVLDSLCREITSHPSVTTSTIRRKCKNLEVTINNLELAKWLLSIYELPPDSDSDDDGCNADGGQRQTRNLEPQSTPVTQVLQYATEIADSGSPPGTSPGDAEEALPVGHERCPAANEKTLSYHKTTSDTRIAVTIETHTPSTSALPLQHDSSFESPLNHGDDPEHASITTVRRWKWSDLVKNQDRKRVVMKAIHELRAGDREDLRSRLNLVGRAKLGREVKAYIDMLHRKESRIHGVLARDLLKIGMISNLFVSWWLCDNSFLKPPSRQQVEELKQYLEESLSDFGIFFDLVSTVMKTTFSNEALQHPERPSQAEIIEISDDDEVSGSQQACAIVFD
ncbi:hypothetical protein T440DRAFT_388251 [Plenodomus tracheiphilus IPT5]|uniref:DUF7607 domain-containing protein n=1 Tax=Plenodomus tracheiphilus IPT5 TaxID=1408161 RepID=A0A6A7BJH6_9PLEO|nr:hypothetical protein T440DRAFT_388251 [Plenodomus tracheiphilus IPT5]